MKRPHYDLIIAWANGAETEYFDEYQKVWADCSFPGLFESTKYRLKQIKPTINWDHVNPTFRWLAVDGDGYAHLYETKPDLETGEYWAVSSGTGTRAEFFASYTRGTCDWRDSLVQRPKGD